MITIPTTLVVGAGGSMAYMFPSGYQLLVKICNFLNPGVDTNEKKILRSIGFEEDRLHWLRRDLLRSGVRSVDAFLERRVELIHEGKAAIACALIEHENPAYVVERQIEHNWYEYLWSCIATPKPEELAKNQLSILTFNYDRSLEYYLFNAIRYTYGLTDDKARQLAASLPIIHLHGQLGKLKELFGKGRDFQPDRSIDAIKVAADGIIIIHEADDGHETFMRAREKLASSGIICFLGFGYHPTNLRRLGISKFQKPTLIGTVSGMTQQEINQVVREIGRGFQLVGQDILTFLRESGVFIGGVGDRA